jgi:RiboL-PSP-HEPN
VTALYRDHVELLNYLRGNDQISFSNVTEGVLPKILLLAAASHLESEIQELIMDYFNDITGRCTPAVSFVQRKAVSRQYHTYFQWESGNANAFFALFGDDFKSAANEKTRKDLTFAQSVKDFVQLGSLRNQLVHQNYASFTLEKTADEIWGLYESACKFIELLPTLLRGQP